MGALSRRGSQIVISAELIHGATGERLWGQTFDRPIADLMRVQDSIVIVDRRGSAAAPVGRGEGAAGRVRHQQPRGLRTVPEGPLPDAERYRGRRARSPEAVHAGDRQRPELHRRAPGGREHVTPRRRRRLYAGARSAWRTPTRPWPRLRASIRTTSPCAWRWRTGNSR